MIILTQLKRMQVEKDQRFLQWHRITCMKKNKFYIHFRSILKFYKHYFSIIHCHLGSLMLCANQGPCQLFVFRINIIISYGWTLFSTYRWYRGQALELTHIHINMISYVAWYVEPVFFCSFLYVLCPKFFLIALLNLFKYYKIEIKKKLHGWILREAGSDENLKLINK